jgi:TP901 family phage tail tape measure protein
MNLMARTTGLEGQALADMEAEIRDMATSSELAGISLKQLTDIGIMGGRMGVDQKQLPGFIKDIARVGIALDDIPVEEAAQGIVQILGVFDLGVEHTTSFASALNKLSNNAKTTGGAILDITGRLKGGASTLGLSPQQTLALATAMSDVGISVEVAGTAMSTVLARMAKDTASFAKVAGVSVQQFEQALVRDPLEALKLFIGGLEGGTGDFSLLEEVGITGARESGVILQLSKAMDNLDTFIQLSNEDWETHASLLRDNEFATQQIASQMTHLDERLNKVSTDVGKELAPALGAARTAWVEFTETNADGLIEGAETLAWAIGGIAPVLKDLGQFGVHTFGLLQASVTGLFSGLVGIASKLASMVQWGANLIPGVELEFADGFAEFANNLTDGANQQFADALAAFTADTAAETMTELADDAETAAEAIEEVADAMTELSGTNAEALEGIAKLTEKLTEQVATFGLSAGQAEIYKLRQLGATDADLAQVQALTSKLEALEAETKAREDLEAAASRIIDQTRTPLEQFQAEKAELETLLSEGLIDTETFERAITAAGEGLGEGLNEQISAGALELGSQEARSAILQAQGAGSGDGLKDVAKTGREQVGILASIDRNIRRQLEQPGIQAFSF